MNRNTESHFAMTPTVNIGRSKFDMSFDHKTTFNNGDLVPIYFENIYPGDSCKMRMSEVVRMMTPIAPVMDNCYLDTYFFFVPERLVWDNFKRFMGENDTAPWAQTGDYEEPQIIAPENGWKKGSLADYFGYPTEVGSYKASALPFRVYCKCWNDWFRDENLKNPVYMSTGDSDIQGTDKTTLGASYDYVVDTEKGAAPCKVAKFHDYFTSGLPNAQKGGAVFVPIGDKAQIKWGKNAYTGSTPIPETEGIVDTKVNVAQYSDTELVGITNDNDVINLSSNTAQSMYADLSQAVGATVSVIRSCFQIQKYLEKDALYGTRYIESVRAHFGVTNPDFRVQRAEYLGGKRVPININSLYGNQQTTAGLVPTYEDPEDPTPETLTWSTENGAPQGTPGAYSVTSDVDSDLFVKSFTEHGYLIGLACVRCDHSYQQGLARKYNRHSKWDYYSPEFANLSNQAILNKEIYLDGTSKDEEAFAYQEAWAEMRYHPNIVTASMRSNYQGSLDIWHYADDYDSRPYLTSEWIDEPTENIARTLAVQNEDQFFGDFYFGAIFTRPLPLYSIPGLIDHH